MSSMKYNLISANSARRLAEVDHVKYIYLEYMKNLNSKIKKNSEHYGNCGIINVAPDDKIKNRVISELEAVGYEVKIIKGHGPEEIEAITISW